jgi:hypothetical protein
MIDSIVALKIIISPPLYYSIFAFMGESWKIISKPFEYKKHSYKPKWEVWVELL